MAHLAQLNVARLRHELDHPDLAPFVEALDAVNAVADEAPGFVWRLQGEGEGNATSIRPWGDDVIVNLSTEAREITIGLPRPGQWKLRFNSDAAAYSSLFGASSAFDIDAQEGGTDGQGWHGNLTIAPYSALIYSQDS